MKYSDSIIVGANISGLASAASLQIKKDRNIPVLDIGTLKHIRKGHVKIHNDLAYIQWSYLLLYLQFFHFPEGVIPPPGTIQ